MEEKEVIKDEPFSDLVVVINGVPAPLNVLGGVKVGTKEYIVVGDLPILEIGKDEYEIFELHRHEEGHIAIASIENEQEYEALCEMWQTKVEEEDET